MVITQYNTNLVHDWKFPGDHALLGREHDLIHSGINLFSIYIIFELYLAYSN
jgi:hypothetical protein